MSEAFDRFYSVYPRKKKRKDALKAWTQIAPDPDLATKIVRIVKRNLESDEWAGPKEFIPYPATFLRGECWKDKMEFTERDKRRWSENREQRAQQEAQEEAQKRAQWEAEDATVSAEDKAKQAAWFAARGVKIGGKE
jgi:hypothetical protein